MRFVTPEVERIALKDDANGQPQWIDVKRELTVGEEKRYRSAGFKQMSTAQGGGESSGPAIDVDWARLAIARVEAYLVDWSATRVDKAGKVVQVPVTRANIEGLAQEDFNEIDDAIQAYVARVAESKKATTVSAS